MRLPKPILRVLLSIHKRAEATPYFNLNGYMIRNWIVGARSPERNAENKRFGPPIKANWLYRWFCRQIVVRAHTILRSDHDRAQHDHPGWSISVVLDGGFWEVCEPSKHALRNPLHYQGALIGIERGAPNSGFDIVAASHNIHWRGPGSIVFRSAKASHRLVLPPGMITKTIFIMGKKTNEWGFYTENGKIPWREYLNRTTE